jgi:adenylylsulfate kinase-like enzyme
MNNIYWLTGTSGAGKTTIAKHLQKELDCIILDGDEMRASISLGAGFSREDRKEHNYRVARLAKILAKQKTVLVAVIAPMKEVRKEIDKICNPIWVYIKRTLPEREGHFYESSEEYFTLDHDKLNIEQSCNKLKQFMDITDNKGSENEKKG